jgi:predicted MFS family arabinose efflux permease
LGSIVIGFITDRYGFEPNFILFGLLAAITMVLIAWKIPDKVQEDTGGSGNNGAAEAGSVVDLIKLSINPRVSGFMLETVVMGMGMATVERLLFLYLVNDLGASNLLCGISVGVSVSTEIPVFWHAERIMKALGHDGMFAVAMICFFTRVFGYTLLTPATKLWVLPLEATHGVTFALFWSASTDVTKALINRAKGWNTTIPILVQTLYTSVGVGLGSVLGGLLMKEWGSREMYRCVAAMVLVLFILHIFASVISRVVFKHPFLPDHDDSVDAANQREEHEGGDTERESFCDEEDTDGV